jgi:DNA-binding NarL/FixJ family response regulator
MLKALSQFLEEQSGFHIIGSATDGYQALRRVRELEPDLVLLDLELPGIHGFEVTRLIKARVRGPVVIMVTADDSLECRAAARWAGTDGFVSRRNMIPELLAAIPRLFPGLGIGVGSHFAQHR